MSARSSSAGRSSKRTAVPPNRCASPIARSRRRLATNTVCTPRSRSARAVSSPFSPAPTISTRRLERSPSMSAASFTATDETDTCERLTSVSVRARLPAAERVAEEPVRDRTGGALHERQLVGALDLPLDLSLADDHRVEPGGDREQVAHRLGPAQRVERAEQLGRPDLRLAREHGQRGALGLDRVCGEQVELGAVAGRDRDRLVDRVGGGQLGQHARGTALGQRELLAQRQRRGLVGGADGQQRAVHQSSSSSCWLSSPTSRSMRAILAPMIAT